MSKSQPPRRLCFGPGLVSSVLACLVLSWSPALRAECARGAPCKRHSQRAHARHTSSKSDDSTLLVASGTVLTAGGVVLLVAGTLQTFGRWACMSTESYHYGARSCPTSGLEPAAYIAGATFLGIGIPLIVIGARSHARPSAPTSTLSTWLSPNTVGLGIRMDM
jgi:hypothetical protein